MIRFLLRRYLTHHCGRLRCWRCQAGLTRLGSRTSTFAGLRLAVYRDGPRDHQRFYLVVTNLGGWGRWRRLSLWL